MAKPRVGTLLLVVTLLTSLVAAANFYVNFTSERARRIRAEDQVEMITRAKEALEGERDELTRAKGALEEQVGQLTQQAQQVAEQFAQEKRAREALTAELAQVRRDAGQVKGQLEGERKEKQLLADDLSKAKQSYQSLSNELTTLRQAKEALEKRVKEMLTARAKEAEQIVVTPPPALPTAGKAQSVVAPAPAPVRPLGPVAAGLPPAIAKVLVVNREYSFVVLNVGSKDGVRRGSHFAVLRDNKPVVTVEVDKVYDNMAAANLLEEAKRGDVREGDEARLVS